MTQTHAHYPARRLARMALTAGLIASALIVAWSPQAHAQAGAQTIEGVCTDAKTAPDWTISGSRYGNPMTPTTDGSGWLRLAPHIDAVLGQVQANAKLASGVPIRVELDYLMWGGQYDGLAIYFADASAAAAGQGGEPGGGLGYCGMTGAYLGVALDEGGNFSNHYCGIGRLHLPGPQEGTAVTGTGVHGNAAAVRGPQADKYPYVASVSLNDSKEICFTCTDRSKASAASVRHVVLDMKPRASASSGYVLNLTVNGREILKNVDFAYAPPAELLMGLAATNGAGGANHEVRNLKLTVAGSVTATNCLNGVGPDGRCLRSTNNIKDWNVFANVGAMRGLTAPPELVDGDLVQKGWDGTAPWTATAPTLASGECIQIGPQSRFGTPVTANQIIVVSRQDDPANAIDPSPTTTFTKYGAVDFKVEYTPQGSVVAQLIPGGDVKGNDKVMRVFDLPKTEQIVNASVTICKTADNNTSPLTEILVWEKP